MPPRAESPRAGSARRRPPDRARAQNAGERGVRTRNLRAAADHRFDEHRVTGVPKPSLRWMLGAVEEVQFGAAYGLVTAGESLHWMDWEVVLPRFAEVLTTTGVLAIAGRSWDGPPMLWERLLP